MNSSVTSTFLGDKKTVAGFVTTDDITSALMYYRIKNSSEFKVIHMDGMDGNTGMNETSHYGFIPLNEIVNGSDYEIYFETVNASQLKSYFPLNGEMYSFNVSSNRNPLPYNILDYHLPHGRIYSEPVSITGPDNQSVILNKYESPEHASIFEFRNGLFTKLDSLENRIPRSAGDFNGNNKLDILSNFLRNGYLDEQVSPFSPNFENVFSDSTENFWPLNAADIDNDGKVEILTLGDDHLFIWEINNYDITLEETLVNFTGNNELNNTFQSLSSIYGNFRNVGLGEIWLIDSGGDLVSFIVEGPDNYSNGISIGTGLGGREGIVDGGDFNGDGLDDLAVLLSSSALTNNEDISTLQVFDFSNPGPEKIFDFSFFDIKSGSTFSSSGSNNKSMSLINLDGSKEDELIFYNYPSFYIFKYSSGNPEQIYFEDFSSYSSVSADEGIFRGDLNKNGIIEISIPGKEGFRFIEFGEVEGISPPYVTSAYSLENGFVYLEWEDRGLNTLIYKGDEINNLYLYDSTGASSYIDDDIELGKVYYYSLVSFSTDKKSMVSKPVSVFAHIPAKLSSAFQSGPSSIIVNFSEKVSPQLSNLRTIRIIDYPYPKSNCCQLGIFLYDYV